ncbi:Protein FAR1-RELATED SEQUENCE 5 [Glycine max]|nr:Protein FAR1-RELATED SEQUENCE 5 [Glycine max]
MGRLTKAEKTLIDDMTKSMVKPRNILLTLKEHNANSCTTIKQIYNARSAFRPSIRGSDLEIQHLMKLLERDQYIHWHKIKDEDMVHDIFWCHHDAVKLVNACNLVFLIDNTYKTNRYRLPLLDFVGVTPTGMTFSAGFAYVKGECVNNLVWALQRFRGLFLKRDALPGVIVTDTDQALMNAVKFDECLKKFEMACAPWPMFVDYVKETWIITHKEKFVSSWTNKVMHLGNTTTNRVESAHSSLKRLLQNSLGDLCSVWNVMNNMIALQHTEIKASFETSTHVVGHVFKKTLYRRLLGMVSRYALNQIVAKLKRVDYAGKNPSSCGCVRRLSFSDQGLSEPEVSIKEVMETISKRFEELDVCGKFTLKTKLWEIAYPD